MFVSHQRAVVSCVLSLLQVPKVKKSPQQLFKMWAAGFMCVCSVMCDSLGLTLHISQEDCSSVRFTECPTWNTWPTSSLLTFVYLLVYSLLLPSRPSSVFYFHVSLCLADWGRSWWWPAPTLKLPWWVFQCWATRKLWREPRHSEKNSPESVLLR